MSFCNDRMETMNQSDVILEVGAEGGSLILHGIRTAEGWQYSRNVLDQTPELLDEPWVEHDSAFVKSWVEALKLLGKYPWHKLYPLQVHPEFRELVFDAVIARYKEEDSSDPQRLRKWRELCGVTEG